MEATVDSAASSVDVESSSSLETRGGVPVVSAVPVPDAEEEERLCVWAWKRRGGWAGGLLGKLVVDSPWEYRSLVVSNHRMLSYYEIGTEDSGTPRGTMDLWRDKVSVHMMMIPGGKNHHKKDDSQQQQQKQQGGGGGASSSSSPSNDDAPTPHQLILRGLVTNKDNRNTPPKQDGQGTSTTTPTSSSSKTTTTTTMNEWKLCFDQQEDMVRLVSAIHEGMEKGGVFQSKDKDRFEHDFRQGDHIYRWEMIVCPPVIYPIQIHAIVLEAGRNCLVVADFGLTGYAKKKDAQFHHVEDDDHDRIQQQILAAFRKLRPTDATQRLNIVTLTDHNEIRKWFKAGYDEESMLARAKAATGGHSSHLPSLGGFFPKKKKKTKKKNSTIMDSPVGKETPSPKQADVPGQQPTPDGSSEQIIEESSESSTGVSESDGDQQLHVVTETTTTTEGTTTATATTPTNTNNQDSPTEQQQQQQQGEVENLPHSDPLEIVLARAHFCLENMHLLPPYHVFFSNSECIAVWCKTGRWSTLQTAVWCSTNSVGAFKTSTLTTIGVAAANPLLAPVIAIGGLLWVSAPILILQKSREAWEEYTQSMTDLFWHWAPNAVFVAAVENWTTILKKSQ